MDSAQRGFLLVMMQPPPAMEEEFNAWYDTEHVPERLALPGFLSGVRFISVEGHPRYLAMYDLERLDVLESEDYRRVSGDNFSPWTKRVTSRVMVDRRAGTQIHPGDALTGRPPRLQLLRFSGIGADKAPDLVSTLQEAFDGRPENTGLRVLACDDGRTCYALVALQAPIAAGEILTALGSFRTSLDQLSTYAPYDPRL